MSLKISFPFLLCLALSPASAMAIETDKAAHFGLSSVTTEASIKICSIWDKGKDQAHSLTCHALGSSLTLSLGIAKEFYDKNHNKKFDQRDIAADVLGIITGNLLQWEF